MKEKLITGLAALGIYFALITLILYYFGYRSNEKKATHFVTKNEKGIAVTLAGPPSPTPKRAIRPKRESRKKQHPKPRNVTVAKKSPTQKASKKAIPKKRPDTKKLFSKVKIPSKKKEHTEGASGTKKQGERTLKQNKHESGVENAYLAKVENLLRGWPAQANFAGEEIDIRLKIYKDGSFDYKILKLSGNPDFNRELINYLKQLQRIGFGSHARKKPYEIEVKFIAHD
ncbi:TonB C-terminal domain-containing protein [Nitratifractor sp.]